MGNENQINTTQMMATMSRTDGYGLPLPLDTDNYDVAVVNEVTKLVDDVLVENKEQINPSTSKEIPEGTDWIVLADSMDQFKRVKLLWGKAVDFMKTVFFTKDEVMTQLETKADTLWVKEQVSHRNLLDNWYFGHGVINQRRKMEYTTSGYSIDRWMLDNNNGGVKLSVLSECIQLTQTNIAGGTKSQSMYQHIEGAQFYAEKAVTISALVRGTGKAQMLLLCDGVAVAVVAVAPSAEWTLLTKTFVMPTTITGQVMSLFCYADMNGKLGYTEYKALKLELGSYQTIARQEKGKWVLNDPPPNPQEELAKCQRYYETLDNVVLIRPLVSSPTVGIVDNGSFKVTKRTNPTIVFDGKAYDGDGVAVVGTAVVRYATTGALVTVSFSGFTPNPNSAYSIKNAVVDANP